MPTAAPLQSPSITASVFDSNTEAFSHSKTPFFVESPNQTTGVPVVVLCRTDVANSTRRDWLFQTLNPLIKTLGVR
jgi:hypothetical protein